MARKSRRTSEKTAPIEETAAVGYIRLSVANKDESCSIENQKLIIEHWAERHQMPFPRYYIDENVSGSTFERDGFKEMVSDIERGVIGCVVVKDLSRLGRDLITTSYYVEEYFPSKRFALHP